MDIAADADLLRATADGDATAADELFRRHHPAVLRYARMLVRDPHTGEDLTSEAFVRTFGALREGKGPREAARPYLYTVVRNTAVDWARAGRRTVVTDEVALWSDLPTSELPDIDELDTLVRAFRSLPERWQTVLWHTVVEDEPVREVAEVLGMKASAVAQLSFRAREGLRQAFLAKRFESHPECAEFTTEMAANIRRRGRRPTRALRRHLDGCVRCRAASREMADLNGRLRRNLPVGIAVIGIPVAPLAELARGGATVPGWALASGATATAAATLAVVLFTVPGGDASPPAADPPGPVPSAPASPAPEPLEALVPEAERLGPRAEPARTRPAGRTADGASGGVYSIRSSTLQACLTVSGDAVVQRRACGTDATRWRRTDASGGSGGSVGFRLAHVPTGRCMARGGSTVGLPWEGGSAYTVVMRSCGGEGTVWRLDAGRLVNTSVRDHNLQASWTGIAEVALKPSSLAGAAAQHWTFDQTN